MGATSLPAPQAPLLLLLLLLLLPVALLLLAAAWCLHWRRKRQRMPYPGERVSQWGGQRAWPESADPLGAIGALPGALTPHQPEDPGLGVGVGGMCGGGRVGNLSREGVGQSVCKKTLLGPWRGTDWNRQQTGGQRGGCWARVQGERTRPEPGPDHGDGEEGTGRVRGQGSSGGMGLETDRLGGGCEEGGRGGDASRGRWVWPSGEPGGKREIRERQ